MRVCVWVRVGVCVCVSVCLCVWVFLSLSLSLSVCRALLCFGKELTTNPLPHAGQQIQEQGQQNKEMLNINVV